jgi:hypothetical protein
MKRRGFGATSPARAAPSNTNTIQHHPALAVPAAPAATATSSNLWLCRCDLLARCSRMTDRTGAGRARRGHCHSRHGMRDSAALFWRKIFLNDADKKNLATPPGEQRFACSVPHSTPFVPCPFSRDGLGSTVS